MAPFAAWAAVEVTFTNPEKFIDASPRGYGRGKAHEATLAALRAHLEKQGGRFLRPGQTLQIEALNLDWPGGSNGGIRGPMTFASCAISIRRR